jgi:hypothetical protein
MGAVAVAVGGAAAVADRRVAGPDPPAEVGVLGEDARVDDVGGDTRAIVGVGVAARQRQAGLIDTVEAPRGRRPCGGLLQRIVGSDRDDAGVALETAQGLLRNAGGETAEHIAVRVGQAAPSAGAERASAAGSASACRRTMTRAGAPWSGGGAPAAAAGTTAPAAMSTRLSETSTATRAGWFGLCQACARRCCCQPSSALIAFALFRSTTSPEGTATLPFTSFPVESTEQRKNHSSV